MSGVPESPRAWIIQTAQHKAIDRLRAGGTLFAEKIEPSSSARDYARVHSAKEYEPVKFRMSACG